MINMMLTKFKIGDTVMWEHYLGDPKLLATIMTPCIDCYKIKLLADFKEHFASESRLVLANEPNDILKDIL